MLRNRIHDCSELKEAESDSSVTRRLDRLGGKVAEPQGNLRRLRAASTVPLVAFELIFVDAETRDFSVERLSGNSQFGGCPRRARDPATA